MSTPIPHLTHAELLDLLVTTLAEYLGEKLDEYFRYGNQQELQNSLDSWLARRTPHIENSDSDWCYGCDAMPEGSVFPYAVVLNGIRYPVCKRCAIDIPGAMSHQWASEDLNELPF